MIKNLKFTTLLVTTLAVGIFYGIAIHKYEIFPYQYIKLTFNKLNPETQEPKKTYGPWSIGIYEGASPFDLTDPENISNPVLTGKDVDDIDATFVADPFILLKDEEYLMFFEVLNRETDNGDIGYAVSKDGKQWDYKSIIIDEDFHLSYPYVFEWENDYYLIPESRRDFSVRLYKASSFPDKWEYMGNLLSGYGYVDPSIFRYNDKWWMFISNARRNILNLYYSDDLLTGWVPHPMNPIVKHNAHTSSPGGRVFVDNDKLYRLTQDDEPTYGIQVFAFEITELTESTYSEKIVSETPVVTKTGVGWNAAGMHHVDLIKVGNKWISAVDGRDE